MSATESKVKTAPKTSKKTLKSAEAEALKVALDAAQVEYVPVTALVKSPLNVRTIPYPAEKVCSMADSIEAIGLLQNLVVHNLPDGRCGVAAGGRRLKALQLLQSENRIDAGYQVMVKKVPDELAVAASMAENEQQMAFCTACSIDGVQGKDEFGRKHQSSLDGVENAIQFDLRDWWKPTADNLFSHMKLPHIVQALSQAGLAGAAQDAAKMKKKDAAEHAEHFLSKIRWVPEWMTSADNQKQLAAKSELSLATSQNDTDADAGDVTDYNNPACDA